MFDLRYHVASLAAVFFALVIGILVGVALASHGLGNTERNRLEEDLRRAQNRGDNLNAQLDALRESVLVDSAFVDRTYKAVMANRLKGKRIAVLFVGSKDDKLQSAILRALHDADAGEPVRIRSLTLPVDEAKLDKQLAKKPFPAAYAGPTKLKALGHALGQEFVAGADTPLWNALENLIVEQKFPNSKRPADGVVIIRTVSNQTGATAGLLKGLYAGVNDVGVPAVGVEGTDGEDSAMKAFQRAGLSTVDDVDTLIGRLALVILLSDRTMAGNFGTKSTAGDGLLPDVAPLPAPASG